MANFGLESTGWSGLLVGLRVEALWLEEGSVPAICDHLWMSIYISGEISIGDKKSSTDC